MHLLKVDKSHYVGQADPYILKSNGRYYIYVTGHDAIYAYHSDNLFDGWEYYGVVMTVEGLDSFWAPSVIELDGKVDGMYYADEKTADGKKQGFFERLFG